MSVFLRVCVYVCTYVRMYVCTYKKYTNSFLLNATFCHTSGNTLYQTSASFCKCAQARILESQYPSEMPAHAAYSYADFARSKKHVCTYLHTTVC